AAVDADPTISSLVGPVRWDVDGKDWEGSLYCRSSRPSVECERAAPGGELRVKPKVIAQRYLSRIEAAGHGIVLMHDRVGHVGSGYALTVAKALIPALVARGYVFAAPVLRFSPLAPHAAPECGPPARAQGDLAGIDPGSAQLGDVNGDGRADICGWSREGVMCALSDGRSFLKATLWLPETSRGTMELCDVNGDGRADVCVKGPEGWACGLSP